MKKLLAILGAIAAIGIIGTIIAELRDRNSSYRGWDEYPY